jgi:hypothetical protein
MKTIDVNKLKDELTRSTGADKRAKLSAEASSLGWEPGEWPMTVFIKGEGMGPDGLTLFRDERLGMPVGGKANFQGFIYRGVESTDPVLEVFND